MKRNKRIDNIIKQAMSNAGVDSRDSTLGPRYRENARTYKDKNLQQLEQVRKKLLFIEPDETLSEEAPAKTSFQSTSETATVGNNMEITGPPNDDQHQENCSEALMDQIFSGPSGPTLEVVPTHLSEEQSTVPIDNSSDYSVLQIGIPEKETAQEPEKEPTNFEIELNIPETSSASNAEEQTVKNTKGGLTSPEMYIASYFQARANSINSPIAECSQSGEPKTIKPQKVRKRTCKTDKMYIDYLSDEDYSTFIDCDEAAFSDEWLGSTSSSNDDEVVTKTAKTKKSKTSRKKNSKKQNNTLDDLNEEIVGEKGLRKRTINLRKAQSQKKNAGQEYVRKC